MARTVLTIGFMKRFRGHFVSLLTAILGVGAAHCSGGIVVTNIASDGGVLPDAAPTPDGAVEPDGAPVPPPRSREPKVHRASDATCASMRPVGTNLDAGGVPDSGPSPYQRCKSDAECTAGTNGRCTASRIGLTCTYDTCAADSDCTQTNGVCACRDQGGLGTNNQCTQGGNCRVDADCAGGKGYCSPSFDVGCNLGFQGFYCHTPKDDCLDDAECNPPGGPGGGLCTYDAAVAKWACSRVMCAG